MTSAGTADDEHYPGGWNAWHETWLVKPPGISNKEQLRVAPGHPTGNTNDPLANMDSISSASSAMGCFSWWFNPDIAADVLNHIMDSNHLQQIAEAQTPPQKTENANKQTPSKWSTINQDEFMLKSTLTFHSSYQPRPWLVIDLRVCYWLWVTISHRLKNLMCTIKHPKRSCTVDSQSFIRINHGEAGSKPNNNKPIINA